MRLARAVAVGAGLVLAAGAGAAAAAPLTLGLDGAGGVRPGDRVAEVERAWGVRLRLNTSASGSPACATAVISGGGRDGFALFSNGGFRSVILYAGARTPAGVRIGSTLGQLRAAYGGRLRSRQNLYTPGARDWFLTRARSPHWQLRFDVSPAGRVTSMGFGDRSVRFVEGCA